MESNTAHLIFHSEVICATILDLPVDILFLVFWCHLHGLDIARCIRVCRSFADLISSDVSLQYSIELAKNGMVDGPSGTLPVCERLQRLRQYASNFRNGIFDHEDMTAHPDYLHQFLSIQRDSAWRVNVHTTPASHFHRERSVLSVLMDGSIQAGIPSRRSIVGIPRGQARSTTDWVIDRIQDLFVTVECITVDPYERFFEVHFRTWSGTQEDHPDAALPCIQLHPLPDVFPEFEQRIHVYSPTIMGCHVLWEVHTYEGVGWNQSIYVWNWRTAQMPVKIDLGDTNQVFVALDDTFILVLSATNAPKPFFTIYSIDPSASGKPLCFLELPSLALSREECIKRCSLRTSRHQLISEGHFQVDPSMSMVSLAHSIGSRRQRPSPYRIFQLLIPYATLFAQIRRVVDANPAFCAPRGFVPWQDWGSHACLRLSVPVYPRQEDVMVDRYLSLVPYGSRMPIVVSDGPGRTRASVYVFDINPRIARHARLTLAAQSDSGAGTTRSAIVDDVEAELPGIVDPEHNRIPFVVYRFELPPERPNWPMDMIHAVRMGMTGFTVTFGTSGPELSDESWMV